MDRSFANVGTEDSSVDLRLRGLSSGTTYTVQASYDSTFITGVEPATFTTPVGPASSSDRWRRQHGRRQHGRRQHGRRQHGRGRQRREQESTARVHGGHQDSPSVIENTPSGEDVGKPIPADDPENDDLTYSLVGPDAGDFDVEDDSGQLLTRSPLDFETKTHFLVTSPCGTAWTAKARRHPARRPDPGRDPRDRRGRNAQPAARTHRDPANCAHGGGRTPGQVSRWVIPSKRPIPKATP